MHLVKNVVTKGLTFLRGASFSLSFCQKSLPTDLYFYILS